MANPDCIMNTRVPYIITLIEKISRVSKDRTYHWDCAKARKTRNKADWSERRKSVTQSQKFRDENGSFEERSDDNPEVLCLQILIVWTIANYLWCKISKKHHSGELTANFVARTFR